MTSASVAAVVMATCRVDKNFASQQAFTTLVELGNTPGTSFDTEEKYGTCDMAEEPLRAFVLRILSLMTSR